MNTIGIDLSVTTRIEDCATGVVTATISAGFFACGVGEQLRNQRAVEVDVLVVERDVPALDEPLAHDLGLETVDRGAQRRVLAEVGDGDQFGLLGARRRGKQSKQDTYST